MDKEDGSAASIYRGLPVARLSLGSVSNYDVAVGTSGHYVTQTDREVRRPRASCKPWS